MTERGPIYPNRLTTQASPPKLRVGRDIFMPDGPGGEELPSPGIPKELDRAKPSAHDTAIDAKAVAPESLPMQPQAVSRETASFLRGPEEIEAIRKEWYAVLTPEELRNPDTRSSIESAISLGIGPAHKAGKKQESPAAREVIENSLLSESERITKAEELLRRELSPKEREALLKAHISGAGLYRNTRAQLSEKVQILKDQGFSKEEIRTLIESGLAAIPINPADYPDPRLQNVVEEINFEINRAGVGNALESSFIQEQRTRVRNLLDQGTIDSVQAKRLIEQLNSWMAETAVAVQEARDEREPRYGRYFARGEEVAIANDRVQRERLFEEIFVGVDSNPGVQFDRALSLESSGKLDHFFTILNHATIYDAAGQPIPENDLSSAAEVTKKREQLFQEFSGRREIRRILHDANWSVSGGGDIDAFSQTMSTFQSEYIDLIFQDKLVGTALHMFEQAFQQIKADNKGELPYEQLAWNYKTKSSLLEDKVWGLMRGVVGEGVDANVPEWRIRRAIILARGFGVASLRFPEIAAQARLPEETTFANATERSSRLGSIYGEAIARYLDPLEHIIEKFAIGEEDRAFLYYFLTGDKKRMGSKKQLKDALKMASHLQGGDKRLIDIINIFRIGGGFSNSSWRTFMSTREFSEEKRRGIGIGMREGRVSGDVDDAIRAKIQRDGKRAGKSEKEMADEIEKILKDKSKDGLRARMVLERRIAMWKDALRANPLRVMWQWEEKEPGKRIKFLKQALGRMSEAEAKVLLSEVEKDLMIIQENTVQGLAQGTITYGGRDDMLNYEVIGGNNPTPEELLRREHVEKYVKTIRRNAKRKSPTYADAAGKKRTFIESIFDKTDVQASPFPFVIGFEDIPFSDFDFINTGGRGFARRINDYANSVRASNELMNLITLIPKTHNTGPLVESLFKIQQFVAQYDKSIAMEVVPYLARGIIRLYDKDMLSRLPLGIGSIEGLLHDSSYVQTVYGREALAWDEGDKFNFTRHLMQNHLVSKKSLGELRKDVGATPANLAVDVLRTYGQLALLLLLYSFAKSTSSVK